MYYFVVLITMMSVAVELAIVAQFRWLQDLAERATIIGMLLSLAVSWGIGALFGAAGMVIMTAAVTSTVITMFIYRLHLIDKVRKVNAQLSYLFSVVSHPIKSYRKEV